VRDLTNSSPCCFNRSSRCSRKLTSGGAGHSGFNTTRVNGVQVETARAGHTLPHIRLDGRLRLLKTWKSAAFVTNSVSDPASQEVSATLTPCSSCEAATLLGIAS